MTFAEELAELKLIAIERGDHIGLLERTNRRSPEEIGIKKVRLGILRSAIARFEATQETTHAA